jgi:hypothetical protein
MPPDEDKEKEEYVPSSKYGTRRKGRLGRSGGRNIKRLWKCMVEAGATDVENAITTGQVLRLEGQPFTMNALTNHLKGKRHLFTCVGKVRVASLDGKSSYDQQLWIADATAFDS